MQPKIQFDLIISTIEIMQFAKLFFTSVLEAQKIVLIISQGDIWATSNLIASFLKFMSPKFVNPDFFFPHGVYKLNKQSRVC